LTTFLDFTKLISSPKTRLFKISKKCYTKPNRTSRSITAIIIARIKRFGKILIPALISELCRVKNFTLV
jgi:hypothetical protein